MKQHQNKNIMRKASSYHPNSIDRRSGPCAGMLKSTQAASKGDMHFSYCWHTQAPQCLSGEPFFAAVCVLDTSAHCAFLTK